MAVFAIAVFVMPPEHSGGERSGDMVTVGKIMHFSCHTVKVLRCRFYMSWKLPR